MFKNKQGLIPNVVWNLTKLESAAEPEEREERKDWSKSLLVNGLGICYRAQYQLHIQLRVSEIQSQEAEGDKDKRINTNTYSIAI